MAYYYDSYPGLSEIPDDDYGASAHAPPPAAAHPSHRPRLSDQTSSSNGAEQYIEMQTIPDDEIPEGEIPDSGFGASAHAPPPAAAEPSRPPRVSGQSSSSHGAEHHIPMQTVPDQIPEGNIGQEAGQTQTEVDTEWLRPIEVMLGSIDHGQVQACSISVVSDELRKPKEEAFKPKVVSVGPLHRGTSTHLQQMEQYKWRYTLAFLHRPEPTGGPFRTPGDHQTRLTKCGEDILELDDIIRASYGGHLPLDRFELAKLMIVDGCFVLELLLSLKEYINKRSMNNGRNFNEDPIFENEDKLLCILSDVALLENQIPFIVLKKLYRKVFPIKDVKIEDDHRVANLFLEAFSYHSIENYGIDHLLHLIHLSTIHHESKPARFATPELKRCATRLRASGVMISPASSSKFMISGTFVDNFDCNISFTISNGVLIIPPLRIKETTEVKWRNLIALEQSRIGIRCKYSSYAMFFKSLICCKHDIQLLEKMGVIVNETNKSKKELLKLFGTITEGVKHMDRSYEEDCKSLNYYRGANMLMKWSRLAWHKWERIKEKIVLYWKSRYAILRREHIPTVWKFFGVLAAVALLVLTILQVYYAARADAK